MPALHSWSVCLVASVLLLTVTLPLAWGQGFGPDTYLMVAEFGMSVPTPTRQLGMGAPIACLNDVQFANPGFAAVRETSSAGLRMVGSDFEPGPHIISWQGHYFHPLQPGQSGLQLTVLGLSSSDNSVLLPQIGPAKVSMSETAVVLDYGHRLTDRFTAGFSVLGGERVAFGLDMPQGGALVDLVAKAEYGGRFGLTYEWRPGDYVGLISSFTRHRVKGTLPTGPVNETLELEQFALGASHHFTPDLLAVLEYRTGKSRNGGRSSGSRSWHFGAEYQFTPGWAVRAGSTDGSATYGLGFTSGHWRADYAYIRNWNDSSVRALFGGSDTHSLQLSYTW